MSATALALSSTNIKTLNLYPDWFMSLYKQNKKRPSRQEMEPCSI